METDAIKRLSDRSYPFQLDAAAKQMELPRSTTTATPSRRLQGQLQLLNAWIIMLTINCSVFVWTFCSDYWWWICL